VGIDPKTMSMTAFEHEALLYAGDDEFLAATLPFVQEGVAADEPVLLVLSSDKIDRVRTELNGEGKSVLFADMNEVGANPARIIPAWRRFLDEHGSASLPVRGIGEPISAGRRPDELVECQRHESLLNVAFAGSPDWWLLCPYDTDALDPAVIDEARRSHPYVWQDGGHRTSTVCRDLDAMAAPFAVPLPEPANQPTELDFDGLASLPRVRGFVADLATTAGFDTVPTLELVAAVHEVAANSVRHGGGRGLLRAWQESGTLLCEVRDRGCLDRPLAGRERPTTEGNYGRGLWLANQFCDLMQIRSSEQGTIIRLHKTNRTGSDPPVP
jgi:anti-sigma regulatory factor (Ser/Thr protein kinase)